MKVLAQTPEYVHVETGRPPYRFMAVIAILTLVFGAAIVLGKMSWPSWELGLSAAFLALCWGMSILGFEQTECVVDVRSGQVHVQRRAPLRNRTETHPVTSLQEAFVHTHRQTGRSRTRTWLLALRHVDGAIIPLRGYGANDNRPLHDELATLLNDVIQKARARHAAPVDAALDDPRTADSGH
ncbi:hypothetical protein LY474_34580 [Myxococcus stipitatus]|uniref:hypothetical protein n=1 Tax=Myxococcus stipitatus TaxID=83455 RepID=UPI001F41BFCA|nr:hypothetical protein [Myxococcus stipitatus]MCE9672946.1 hypothetical protein [Myxococcus stipitatus]